MVNRVVEGSKNLGMKVNIEKTEVQRIGKAHKIFNIVIKNQNLKPTVNFVYLGGNLSSKEETIPDVKRWIGLHSRHKERFGQQEIQDNNKITSI